MSQTCWIPLDCLSSVFWGCIVIILQRLRCWWTTPKTTKSYTRWLWTRSCVSTSLRTCLLCPPTRPTATQVQAGYWCWCSTFSCHWNQCRTRVDVINKDKEASGKAIKSTMLNSCSQADPSHSVLKTFACVFPRTDSERCQLLHLQLLWDRRQDERTEHRVSATGISNLPHSLLLKHQVHSR